MMSGQKNVGQSGPESKEQQGEAQKRRKPTAAEWITGAVATLLVLAATGFLAYEAWKGTASPPVVSLRQDRVLETATGYVVELTAINTGGATAQGLTVEGALHESGKVVEKSNTTLQWVPAHTERQGGLYFTKDPRQYRLELRPLGYDRP